VRGAALLSAFILVGDGDRLPRRLFDVYRALEIAWRRRLPGALEDVGARRDAAGRRSGGAGRAQARTSS
jgi:hypothetical protein